MNNNLSKKDRALIKGALRRVFSRSEIRMTVVNTTIISHIDKSRPRVKTWCKCPICLCPTPKSYMIVDHVKPIVPIDMSFEELVILKGWEFIIDSIWCPISNLQAICNKCHEIKTKGEQSERKRYKSIKRTSATSSKRGTRRSSI